MDTIDTRRLAELVRVQRGDRGLRETAKEIGGISASTLSRIEKGKVPDLDTYIRLCNWLGVSTDRLVRETDRPERVDKGEGEGFEETIVAHLRADRTLDPKTANALTEMIRLAYRGAAGISQEGD